jgi:hypothetical protein
MKNILSSLNESEKKRILEMHKNASNRHYLNEQDPKAQTSTKSFASKREEAVGLINTDYFSFDVQGSPTEGVNVRLYPNNNASNVFITIGNPKIDDSYNCKTGWVGKKTNPFEDNIKLQYNTNGLAKYKTEAGKSPAQVATSIVSAICNYLVQPPKSPTPIASTSTTQQGSTANATLTSSDDFQSCPTTGYIEYEYDEKSTKDDVRIILKRNGSYKQGFYSTQGGNKLGTYSCKSKTWYSWGDPTTNMWESDIIIKPLKGGYPDIQADNGKTPRQISEEIINCMCNKAVWK